MTNVRRGRRFEALAEVFLRERGWRVLDRNVRLVAFVEVKGRSGPDFGHPLEAITWRKRRAISVAANAWISRSDFTAESYRFDAVSVRLMPGGALELDHVEGAWTE
jgi:putative endonuclease